MNIERSKLNSRQKRDIFQRRFGEILSNEGFIYTDNYFVRVHPEECILLVGLDLKRNCYVVFDAIPFCHKERICNPTIAYRVDSFYKVSSFTFEEYYLKAFENGRFELQFELFDSCIKERFLQIHSVSELLKFENDIIFPVLQDAGRWYSKMLECLQMQNYEGARCYIHRYRNHVMSCLKEEESNLRFNLQRLESKHEKKSAESSFNEYAQMCKDTLNSCDLWMSMISNGEFNRIQEILNSRIHTANEFCKIKWNNFYKNT